MLDWCIINRFAEIEELVPFKDFLKYDIFNILNMEKTEDYLKSYFLDKMKWKKYWLSYLYSVKLFWINTNN
jgi:hypothetical protein